MKRRFRLTRSADFQRVRRYGRSYAHPLIVLVVLPNEAGDVRIGFAVGRNIGNAVRRNRVKRQLRAAVLDHLDSFQPGWDLLFIARKPICEADFQQMNLCVETLLSRAQMLRDEIR